MANKSKMACNRPVPSDRPGKKKMVKACAGGRRNSCILVPRGTEIIIPPPPVNLLRHAILATLLVTS
jgi:hypothetical protein